jgi:hypothetical protein
MTPAERAPRSDPGAEDERIMLSVPADFYHTLAGEFQAVIRLLNAGSEVARAAELDRRRHEEATPGEPGPGRAVDEDGIGRLVLREHGRTIEWLKGQFPPDLDLAEPVDVESLRAAARTIPAHAADRLNRLFIAFDLIVGVPMRKELARRAVSERARRADVTGGPST